MSGLRFGNEINFVCFFVKFDYRCNKDIMDDLVENYCLMFILELVYCSFVICCIIFLFICVLSVLEIVLNVII